jgi:hypothetical protein
MVGRWLMAQQTRLVWALSVSLFILGALVTIFFRYPGLDQSFLFLIAWEYVSGKELYVDIYDLPSSVFLHSIPVLLHTWLGWPLVVSWDVFVFLLCSLGGLLYATLVSGNFLWPGLIWAATSLLTFDDYIVGQREFWFILFWVPYLAARLRIIPAAHVAFQTLAGFCVGFMISVKPHFALFVLLIDLPLFLTMGRATAMLPFTALVAAGVSQIIAFFVTSDFSNFLRVIKLLDYYATIGFNFHDTFRYIFTSVSFWLMLILSASAWGLGRPRNRLTILLGLCIASAAVGLILMVLQGQPRPYYMTPVAFALIAAGYILLQELLPDKGSVQRIIPNWQMSLAVTICVTIPIVHGFTSQGLLVGLGHKYLLQNPQVAFVGRPDRDLFYDWVRANVPKNENIAVIALQPGFPALDPVLSLVRLQRRAFSRSPVLQFHVRAAIASGDADRTDQAIDLLISDIESSNAGWLFIRRGGPGPPLQDVSVALRDIAKFDKWRRANFVAYDQFGDHETFSDYEVYRSVSAAR